MTGGAGRPQAGARGWHRAAGAALALALAAVLAACGGTGEVVRPATMEITLLGFNDLHGNLAPPGLAVNAAAPGEAPVLVPAGGASYLASLVAERRAARPHSVLVAAGDLIGASPMASSLFLDEPTIEALNLMRLDFAATGNHEYDQGWNELLRMQRGGCERFTPKVPCQLSHPFAGARFQYLAANTLRADGQPLLPATGIKFFEQDGVRIGVGFIGVTLKNTPHMVRPSGVAGLRFADEATTINAQIAPLRAQGADVIVVLIHEGGSTRSGLQDASCSGLSGDIVPILDHLSDQVDVVISGHTHRAYLCDYARVNPAKPFLLTSAGLYGTLLTEVDLTVDLRTRRVRSRSARQHIAQGQAFTGPKGAVPLQPAWPVYPADPAVAALVARYEGAAASLAAAPAGRLAAPATRQLAPNGESVLGRIVADAILAATQSPEAGGAQLAFMNSGGVRADLVPAADGSVTFGQLYSVQPFGNTLMALTLSGEQIRRLLEQQFDSGTNTVDSPRILQVSQGFGYVFDRTAPAGQRISHMQLHGQPIEPGRDYRVGVQSYLGTGGDNFSVFTQGRNITGGGLDVDALADYIRAQSTNGPMALPQAARFFGR
ncbi:MAG: bifunctional metallophosphatase/5'-nucleotidase [Burkholderiaceae bacterium]